MKCTRGALRRTLARRWREETGASTAEYAITVLATNYWLGHT